MLAFKFIHLKIPSQFRNIYSDSNKKVYYIYSGPVSATHNNRKQN